MLVIIRGKNEEVMIGDDILIAVLDVRGDKARIGISCPREISIHRKEVWDALRREEGEEGVGS